MPLTLARMPAETRYGIFEIGMNHPGEIRPLVKLVRPHVAIVTTVEPVHLAYFDSEAAIAEAKAEIFEGLEPGGTAILNRDNHMVRSSRRARARAAARGSSPSASTRPPTSASSAWRSARTPRASRRGSSASPSPTGSARPAGTWCRTRSPSSPLRMRSAPTWPASCRRSRASARRRGGASGTQLSHPSGPFTLIDESYNANPASMRAALALLGQASPEGRGRRIAVLGDMLELGEDGPAQHRGLARGGRAVRRRPRLPRRAADGGALAGLARISAGEPMPESAAELEPILLKTIGPGDVIMMKASLGTRLGPVVEAVKRHFAAGAA